MFDSVVNMPASESWQLLKISANGRMIIMCPWRDILKKMKEWQGGNFFRKEKSFGGTFFYVVSKPRKFYLTGGMTNFNSFIQGLMDWSFSELFFSVPSLRNQYNDFNP